jgi:hypothetical protein
MKLTAELLLTAAFIAATPCIHAQSDTLIRGQIFLEDLAQANMAAQLAKDTDRNKPGRSN